MLYKKNSFRNKQVSFIKDESNEPTYDQTNEAKVNLFRVVPTQHFSKDFLINII